MSLLCKIFGHKEKWVEEKRFLKEDEEPSEFVRKYGEMADDDREVQIKKPICERCGEDLTEELMKKRLRKCGYCGTFDEPKNMSSHGFFGKVCHSCASISEFWERWTESGEIVGVDICPRCGSKMKFETMGSYEEPDIGPVTATRDWCPNCRFENLGYM